MPPVSWRQTPPPPAAASLKVESKSFGRPWRCQSPQQSRVCGPSAALAEFLPARRQEPTPATGCRNSQQAARAASQPPRARHRGRGDGGGGSDAVDHPRARPLRGRCYRHGGRGVCRESGRRAEGRHRRLRGARVRACATSRCARCHWRRGSHARRRSGGPLPSATHSRSPRPPQAIMADSIAGGRRSRRPQRAASCARGRGRPFHKRAPTSCWHWGRHRCQHTRGRGPHHGGGEMISHSPLRAPFMPTAQRCPQLCQQHRPQRPLSRGDVGSGRPG